MYVDVMVYLLLHNDILSMVPTLAFPIKNNKYKTKAKAMASLLQKSTPWIEDNFVYACSFDASLFDGDDDKDSAAAEGGEEECNDEDEQIEPQTDNTIPAGLHDDDDSHHGYDGGMKKHARKKENFPIRGSKIVQVIDRGGDPNFYTTKKQTSNHCYCPPYLVLHDGQYSTIAFLSEEAYDSSMMRQDAASGRRGGAKQQKQIPKNSLISVSQYTISTIKCCTTQQELERSNNYNRNNHQEEDMLILQLLRPDMPQPHLSQIRSTLNTNLLLCLYILGPITFIGAENQGLIGNAINVNCSIKVRRVLQFHMAQFEKVRDDHTNEEEEEDDYQHWTMVQRLEACHCYYQFLKEKQGGTMPVWPWESRLVGEEINDENDNDLDDEIIASNNCRSTISINDEVVDLEAKGTETTVIAAAASPGRVARMIRKYENLEELLHDNDDEEECDADADVADDDDAVGSKTVGRTSTGTHLAQWDLGEDQLEEEEEGEEEAGKEGNKGGTLDGEKEDKEGDSNAKNDDPLMEQGNVAELFENFEDINELLELGEDSPPMAEVGVNSFADATVNAIDSGNVVERITEQGEKDSPQGDESNFATFTGIDQMIVDDEEEEEENDEQGPLLTQQEFDTRRDNTECQIPIPPLKVSEESTKSSELGRTKEYIESQIPLPLPENTQSSDESEREDIGTKSQIPFPSRKKQRNQSLNRHDDDEEAIYPAESQVPVPQKKQPATKKDHSPRKPSVTTTKTRDNANTLRPKRADVIIYDSDDSEDWMRIRQVKSSAKSTRRTSRVQSQIAGERSEECISNLLKTLKTSQLLDNEVEEIGEDRTLEKETQQPGSTSSAQEHHSSVTATSLLPKRNAASHNASTTSIDTSAPDHRVRFVVDNTDQHPKPVIPRAAAAAAAAAAIPPAANQRELFTSVSVKASKVLLRSSESNDETATTRKRKAKEEETAASKKKEFSFASVFDTAKKLYSTFTNEV